VGYGLPRNEGEPRSSRCRLVGALMILGWQAHITAPPIHRCRGCRLLFDEAGIHPLFAAASTNNGKRCPIRRTGRCQRSARSQGRLALAIQIREEPRLIGIIRIGVRSAEHRQGDLGYAVHPDHWGKGYATEALRRILEFGFEELSLERIWATADVRNVASRRVMEKAGMEREGLMRHLLLVRGAWRDSVLYARINPTSPSP